MVDTTKLYSLIAGCLNVLYRHRRSQSSRKLALVQPFYCKAPEISRALGMVDCVKEMLTNKSYKYGKYGSFEHLLSLFMLQVFSKMKALLMSSLTSITWQNFQK